MTRRDFVAALPAGLAAAPRTQGAGLISFRIGATQWMPEKRFQGLLDFFARHPGTADELAFFTSATHPPLPLAEIERRAEKLATLMPRVRALNMGAGINVLATMGHHVENLANSLNAPWQRVVDPSGVECRGVFCPLQEELLDYADKVYTAVARAGPDFIWVDDDVRLQGHKPAGHTCFCNTCIRRFSSETGRDFTRQSLVEAFSSGSIEQRLKVRRAWLEHNRWVIDNLLRRVEQAVHRVKPDLVLGFMTGDRFYEGYGFERWAKTLAGPGNIPVRWRPGGGFYSDETPLQMIEKAHAIGRQVSALPGSVTVIQSEVENFPYQRLRKSERTTVVEAGAYMAAGTTGTAFNVINMQPDPLDEYEPLLRRIEGSREFYAEMREALGRTPARGLWPAWSRDLYGAINPEGEWLRSGRFPLNAPYALGEIGIPLGYDARECTATAISGAAPYAFSAPELRRMFSGGVLLDADAWQCLDRLGLSGWTGVCGVDPVDRDAMEVLAAHPLNSRFAGWSRDCRQSFWAERAYRLEPSENAQIVARMGDYGDRDLGPTMTAFRNSLGGRVVVMGYFPWSQIHSLPKTSQLKNIADWLSGDALPLRVETFAKVAVWCRERAVVVVNTSLDPVESLALRWKHPGSRFRWLERAGPRREVSGDRQGEMVRVTLNNLAPWSLHLLVSQS
ncbi:MAG: hypothetical protein ACKV22_31025 [Bryobacteraceae bacterium]